jgi:hypothetical protein
VNWLVDEPVAAQGRTPVKVTRLYVGTDGKTKVEEFEIPLKPRDAGSELSAAVGVTSLQVRRTTPQYFLDWHPAPRRQLVVTLSGESEIELEGGRKILEPLVKPRFKLRAPGEIRPRPSPALHDAFTQFVASQKEVHAFLQTYADIDLAGLHFPNPFVRGIRFSLATGVHVLAAHTRRHVLQAWRVRQAEERSAHPA